MTLKLFFENPQDVTTDVLNPDLIHVEFFEHQYFIDAKTYIPFVSNYTIDSEIPPQLTDAEARALIQMEAAMNSSMTVLASGNIIVNLIFSMALKYLWNLINLLQFLIYFEDWLLSIPILPKTFFRTLQYLVYMEFIPHEAITNRLSNAFGFETELE